jgi:hypothetical protein
VRADADVTATPLDDGLAGALTAAAAFRTQLVARQQDQCDRLAERLPLPQLHLPYYFTADVGPTEVELLADELVLGVGGLPDGIGL